MFDVVNPRTSNATVVDPSSCFEISVRGLGKWNRMKHSGTSFFLDKNSIGVEGNRFFC
jgi:hypothetical protein